LDDAATSRRNALFFPGFNPQKILIASMSTAGENLALEFNVESAMIQLMHDFHREKKHAAVQ
jgi:hypothetical protein